MNGSSIRACVIALGLLVAGCSSGGGKQASPTTTIATPTPLTTPAPPVPPVFVGGSSAGSLPNGLHVEMTLGAPTVQLGSNIPYRVVLRNNSSQPKTIGQGPIDCVLGGFAPALFDAKGKFPADKPPLASDCKPATTLAPRGAATFTGWLPAQRVGFKTGARHGHFTVRLTNVLNTKEGTRAPGASPKLGPIAVEFNAPDLTIRLQVPNRAVIAGHLIKGTVVFDNAGRTEYTGAAGVGAAVVPPASVEIHSAK